MSLASDLIAEMAVWDAAQRPDGTSDLQDFLAALGAMAAEVELYAADEDDGTAGWSILWDVDRIPGQGLPWLAQFAGEQLPEGISDAEARAWIKAAPNQIRGTKDGIAAAAQRHLTGNRTVMMRPRHKLDGTADPDWLAVITLTSETPTPAVTKQDILNAMPADIMLDYSGTTASQVWAALQGYANWNAVAAANPTWADAQQGVVSTANGWLMWTVP